MAEMTENGAIGLAQAGLLLFTMRIVGFGDIDGDDAALMAGGHALLGGVREEIEAQALGGIRFAAEDGQAQAVQAVEEPALGHLQPGPLPAEIRLRDVGDGAGEPAGCAEFMRIVGRHHPIAGGFIAEMAALAVALMMLARRQGAPAAGSILFERADDHQIGEEAELMLA